MTDQVYDVAIIGCGCVGAFAAMYLAKYELKVVVVEAAPEPAFGSTKANSGIVHSSHNTDEGTVKYTMVDEGNRRIREFSKLLNFGYAQCGEIVVAKNETQMPALESMFQKAKRSGLDAEMLDAEELRIKEPHVKGYAAMFVPEAGVVNPYEMTIAVFNTAEHSGCHGLFGHKIVSIVKSGDLFSLEAANGRVIKSSFVVNAAGLYADEVAKMINPEEEVKILPRKGEEYLLDKDCDGLVKSIIFPLPEGKSKGILVIPTVDKTIMVGPTAVDIDDKDDRATSSEGMKTVFDTASELVDGLNLNMVIASFTGVRAVEESGDFVISCNDRFINLVGIESPGMTASPVLGERAAEYVLESLKPNFNPHFAFAPLSVKFANGDKEELVKADGNHSRILCGCEIVTVADVNNAITDGAKTVDGVKARTRAGMGRCQGGFCTNAIIGILSQRLRIPEEMICKREYGTQMSLESLKGPSSSSGDLEDILPYTPVSVKDMQIKLLATDPQRIKAILEDESPLLDVLVIGGGPSGLAAGEAAAAALPSDKTVVVVEKSDRPGGVLIECIHTGFGLKRFEKELTGPEYAELLTTETVKSGCSILLNTFVISVSEDSNVGYAVQAVISGVGWRTIRCKQLIITNGCRERSRQNIKLAGTRPAGVFTAGMAEEMINLRGQLPGRKVVILGSGDIGLIMARRCTLEGAHVLGVYELLPRCSGLQRNVAQCLTDFSIPLYLSHTVVTVLGKERVEAVEIAPVDAISLTVDLSRKFTVECDCLLLSVGLIPEAKIAIQAGARISAQSRLLAVDSARRVSQNAFAAGNCLEVHDLADDAAAEGELAGRAAAGFICDGEKCRPRYEVSGDSNVLFCIPDYIYGDEEESISLRVKKPLGRALVTVRCGDIEVGKAMVEDAVPAEMIHVTAKGATGDIEVYVEELSEVEEHAGGLLEKTLTCIVCPRGCKIKVAFNAMGDIEEITGNTCPRGEAYAREEHIEPFRVFSTAIFLERGEIDRLPVKLGAPIPKSKLLDAAQQIRQFKVSAPVEMGQIVGKVHGALVLACCSVGSK